MLSCLRLARWSVTLAAKKDTPRTPPAFSAVPLAASAASGTAVLGEWKKNRRGGLVLAASVRLHRASRWHPFKISPLRNKTGLTVRSDSILMTAIFARQIGLFGLTAQLVVPSGWKAWPRPATMPELPEVETMCRGVAQVVGCRIVGIVRPECKLKPITITPALAVFRRRAVGRTIEQVGRIGKRVVLRLDGSRGDSIVIEPRMTGLVLLAEPPNRDHLRLVFQLAAGVAPELMFWDRRGLGVVRLVAADEFERRYSIGLIGPDALTVTPELLRERLGAAGARSRWRFWINVAWPASATCMRLRSCTWLAYTRHAAATGSSPATGRRFPRGCRGAH